MVNEKRLMDEFKNEVMSKFIELCRGNDYNKLTLLRIGETIDRIYEKYSLLPTVDAVEVVRCKDCVYYYPDTLSCKNLICCANWYSEDFCSYGVKVLSKCENETKCIDLGVCDNENA